MALPAGTPVGLLQGVVNNPATKQDSDGKPISLLLDHNGAMLVRELGGKRLSQTLRGNMFSASSGTAGTSLLAPGGTTAGFWIANPSNSGLLVSLEQLKISGASTETVVIAGIAWEYGLQAGVGTAKTSVSWPLGAGRQNPLAKVYVAGSITAMTFGGGLGASFVATTSPGLVAPIDFDGTLVISPGYAVNFCSTITQSADIVVADLFWSEWLP